MNELVQRVINEISAEKIVDLASDLIRIPSFKTEETPLARQEFIEAAQTIGARPAN